ncbi:hypothetical protein GYMLUDRAFT_262897 [Collybiopsis luxurians FD-317 M1]|uniref:Inositol-pentakisphosphate 2-kinase n=1 Tax=Collybiopsis luxurians FD-317 M1 TaxID=944289 RepID=A0A0D0BR81_9AGAR|nr:hypothetical protein GYMLUDRAFT_262897 [Collybiopsis luxurians FD-317 M1]
MSFSTDISANTRPDDWNYLSEGASTAVFTYSGSESQFQDKVLRVRKDDGTTAQDETASLLFQEEIVPRLIPEKHLVTAEPVFVSKAWLQTLSIICAALRPAWRKDNIDLSRNQALLVPNLVASPVSVEIKPKWSFLKGKSPQTCRYCMHALTRGWITSYCPLDLFSSSSERVAKAIYGLYDAWAGGAATQNNFRLFVGGEKVPPNNLFSALQKHGILPPAVSESGIRDIFVETLQTSLLNFEFSTLLKTLKQLQWTLDGSGIEGLAMVWEEVHSQSYSPVKPSFGKGFPQPTPADWQAFVTEYLEGEHGVQRKRTGAEKLRYHILSYLLSATFKDCSIIIMLPGLLDKTSPESSFPSRITLVDLDPKPIERLQKWLDQNREILQDYDGLVSRETKRKICVDDWEE